VAEEYIILIVEQDWDPSSVTEDQWVSVMQAHGAFAKAVADAGAEILGGDALQPPASGVRITPARDGKPAVFTDGPFADTKEFVTGYYKIKAKDAAQARELAALTPTSDRIELYPVMDTGSMQEP
jgi:hypothetical protein